MSRMRWSSRRPREATAVRIDSDWSWVAPSGKVTSEEIARLEVRIEALRTLLEAAPAQIKTLEARIEVLERARRPSSEAMTNLAGSVEKLRQWEEENSARLKTFLDD